VTHRTSVCVARYPHGEGWFCRASPLCYARHSAVLRLCSRHPGTEGTPYSYPRHDLFAPPFLPFMLNAVTRFLGTLPNYIFANFLDAKYRLPPPCPVKPQERSLMLLIDIIQGFSEGEISTLILFGCSTPERGFSSVPPGVNEPVRRLQANS
jgi:hypothetical protein